MIRDFLEKYRPGGPWALTAIIPDGKTETHTYTEAEVDEAVAWAKRENKRKNIYFSVNPTTKLLKKKAAKEDIARVEYLQVDVDPRAGEDLHEERERILKLLTVNRPEVIPDPTLIIDSGGGYQAFWRLEEPLELNGDLEKIEKAEAYNIKLAEIFQADHCHTIEHLMRLPFTINRLNAKKRAKGRTESDAKVHSWKDVSYPITAFKPAPITTGASISQIYATGKTRAAIALGEGTPMGTEELRQWAEANGKTINDHTLALVATGQDPLDSTKYPSRSEALFRVCCDLVRADVPDEIIFAVITDQNNEIGASVRDKPNWQGYAQRQVERAREEAVSPSLRRMNDKHFVVQADGDQTRVMTQIFDSDAGRIKLVSQSFTDINNFYSNQVEIVGFNENGQPITKPLGKFWIAHPLRRTYEAMYFNPGKRGEGLEVPNQYNLWRGWGVTPRQGDWSLMREHISKVLACGNPEYADYILRWAAWAVQNPDKPAEVALVFRGGRGTGKGVFGRALKDLFGQHGLQVFSPSQVTGKFNAHFLDCCLLFADEAIVPGKDGGESQFKGLISEPRLPIERKGRDIITAPNRLHAILASNEEWVVPAGGDERRFAVFDVCQMHRQDKEYFSPLYKQLDEGGIAAMLYDLLEMDLGDWHPRWDIPQTDALSSQKVDSLRGLDSYIFDLLDSGVPIPGAEFLRGGTLFVSSQDLVDGAEKKGQAGDSPVTHRRVQMLLGDKLGAKKHRKSNGGKNGYLWNLADLRAAWDREMFKWSWGSEPVDNYDYLAEDQPF